MGDLTGLDDVHLARMLWAEDPDHGGRIKLTATLGLVRDYRNWWAAECKHLESGIVAVRASNGAPMYREQCLTCGFPFGQWIARAKVPNIQTVPEVSAYAFAEYEQSRLAEWRSVQVEHARQQLSASDNEYAQYLRSETWKLKRQKVLERAKGICEGCREREATQIHHLTYRHVQDEFLWELVAICDDCHNRVHLDGPK